MNFQFKSRNKYFNKFLLSLLALLFCAQLTQFVFIATGYHDFATFIAARDLLVENTNPYLNNFFRNGYVLIFPLWVFSITFGENVGPGIWNLLNLSGLLVPLILLTPKKSWGVRLLILVTVLFTSPARSMFANVQHTGIVIGIISYIFIASGKVSKSLRNDFFLAALLLIAFELKPQTVVPLIFFLLFSKKMYRCLGIWAGISFLSHIGLSIMFRMPLDFLWFKSLAGISKNSVEIDAGDNSIWGVMSYLFGITTVWSLVSYLTYLSGLLVLSNCNKLGIRSYGALVLIFVTPLFLSYVHPYDFIIISMLVVSRLSQQGWPHMLGVSLILLLAPTVADFENFYPLALSSTAILLFFYIGVRNLQGYGFAGTSLIIPILSMVGYSVLYFNLGLEQLRIGLLYGTIMLLYLGFAFGRNRAKESNFLLAN